MLGQGLSTVASAGFVALLLLAPTDAALAVAIAPTLGTAGSYAVLGGSAVTNVPAAGTIVNGNLGVWPNLAISGFPPGIVVPPGTIHAGDAAAQSAQTDVTAAFIAIGSASQPCPPGNDLTGQDLGGKSLAPGVYCFSTSAQLTGALTLNGTATDVWIFQIGSTLTTATGSSVVFTGGANACNVFWQVGTSATIGTTTSFNGTILALSSITLDHGANIVSGRALARNAAVTLDDNTIDATVCSGVAPGGVGAAAVFGPAATVAGGVSRKTITLSNAGDSAATITSFTDNLPIGLAVATPPSAGSTCGGALSAPAGAATVTMAGGTIPAAAGGIPGVCTITVNVTAATPGSYANALPAGALVTSAGNNVAGATAVLSVGPVAATDVPTLTQWTTIALMLLLAVAGLIATGRRIT
jgi:uncharacterized repeat protein (TIGR01451 family)